jgi:hypothetical protein
VGRDGQSDGGEERDDGDDVLEDRHRAIVMRLEDVIGSGDRGFVQGQFGAPKQSGLSAGLGSTPCPGVVRKPTGVVPVRLPEGTSVVRSTPTTSFRANRIGSPVRAVLRDPLVL